MHIILITVIVPTMCHSLALVLATGVGFGLTTGVGFGLTTGLRIAVANVLVLEQKLHKVTQFGIRSSRKKTYSSFAGSFMCSNLFF
jgi:hypothetical protein